MIMQNKTKLIPLTRGLFAIVDSDDFEYLNQWKWHAQYASGIYYAYRSLSRKSGFYDKKLPMTRIILSVLPTLFIDHKNGNTLDNRKENLRICNRSQNNANKIMTTNKHKFKGIFSHSKGFVARVEFKAKRIYCGYFKTAEEAAKGYDKKALELFGEFACLNFPKNNSNRKNIF